LHKIFNRCSSESIQRLIIIIPCDKRRYRIAPAHCPVTVTQTELILHTDGPSGLNGVEWFLLDNMRERDALRVLAGLDEQ
jgi:hypothetical protein